MQQILLWLSQGLAAIPLQVLDVWGRFAYLTGWVMVVLAFAGCTLRPAGQWGLGPRRQTWNGLALASVGLSFTVVLLAGWLAHYLAPLQGAPTFGSFRSVALLVCLVLFGYPALLAAPAAFALADLLAGAPGDFIRCSLPGYFIAPRFARWPAPCCRGRRISVGPTPGWPTSSSCC